ncbi:hypothetical protein CBR_g261 [Chara braunii]|uniref:C2H2-type domain-containing protein n=1 Tax=Chara braunii TaxID=69332 RepID=A0A388JMC5_CHABU|nr:hypothetical protein CBR_g261 [Chara braunii]|eukprot:GBG58862.1 hypothetical protein CBR_g261 [Chara braunii]
MVDPKLEDASELSSRDEIRRHRSTPDKRERRGSSDEKRRTPERSSRSHREHRSSGGGGGGGDDRDDRRDRDYHDYRDRRYDDRGDRRDRDREHKRTRQKSSTPPYSSHDRERDRRRSPVYKRSRRDEDYEGGGGGSSRRGGDGSSRGDSRGGGDGAGSRGLTDDGRGDLGGGMGGGNLSGGPGIGSGGSTLGSGRSMAAASERYRYESCGPPPPIVGPRSVIGAVGGAVGRGGPSFRGGSGDERAGSQGRQIGPVPRGGPGGYQHPSGPGPHEWLSSGRGGGSYEDVQCPGAPVDGGPASRDSRRSRENGGALLTYKQFIVDLEDDITPEEAQRRYEEYRKEYSETAKRSFFESHREEEWLKEKYDPTVLEAFVQRRNENAQTASKEFVSEFEAGALDTGPQVSGRQIAVGNGSTMVDGGLEGEPFSDDESELAVKHRKRARELKGAANAPVVAAGFADPARVAADVEQTFSLVKKLDAEKGISGNTVFDSCVKISNGKQPRDGNGDGSGDMDEDNASGPRLQGLSLLDALLTYLWRVHGVDYYGAHEQRGPPKGLRHVRAESSSKDKHMDQATPMVEFSEWERKVDSTWQARLQAVDPLIVMLGKEKIEKALTEALEAYIRKIRDEKYGWKYGCGAKNCTKLFHGPEYVQKHLKLKHPDLVSELTAPVREEVYFQNYMNDPDAPVHQGLSPRLKKEKSGRRRRTRSEGAGGGSGSERRESERSSAGRVRESDRYNGDIRGERDRGSDGHGERDMGYAPPPPLLECPAPFDGPGSYDGGPPFEDGMDGMVYDFNGRPGNMSGPPPLGPHMPPPPPVLMPLPGAGPLGPFVPAPPEVTMRMLGQGQPPSGAFHPGVMFDGNGGMRGSHRTGRMKRVGRPWPMRGMGMGPPLLGPLPHMLREDPRPRRSYVDLDAPTDEVTVIDYRSL